MSTPEQKLASVENGLKIAEFIQANRESTNPTYGRSAITKPTTKDRTKAWEAFTDRQNQHARGSKRRSQSLDGNPEDEGSVPDDGNDESSGYLSSAEKSGDEPVSDRDNSGRDAEGATESDEEGEDSDVSDNEYFARGGSPNRDRNEESVDSSSNIKSTPGGGGSEDRGRAVNNDDKVVKPKAKTHSVKETTQEDLEEMMEDIKPQPERRLQFFESLKEIESAIPAVQQVVKKTTDENIQLPQQAGRPLSRSGAIPPAPQSPRLQEDCAAYAENAHPSANYARMTNKQILAIEEIVTSRTKPLEAKIDTLLDNQNKIISKLNAILEVKEDIDNIKKTITNQSLALSTIDGYISELMIAIPKSGIDVEDEEQNPKVNPDLRVVIGREKSRGRKEIIKPYEDSQKIEVGDDLFIPPEVSEEFITKPIDNTVNNAAHFVPSEDRTSATILKAIVRKETKNSALIYQLHELIDSCFGTIPMTEIYNSVKELLKIDKESANESDEE